MNQTIKQLCSVMFENHTESLHLSNHKALDWHRLLWESEMTY